MNSSLTVRLRAITPLLCGARGMRKWDIPPDYKDVLMPPFENRLLPLLDRAPVFTAGQKAHKYERRFSDLRGPELIHNTLMYNQYGIMALSGGNIKECHIHQIRELINRRINPDFMFAIWRIDPPWKSICKRAQGKRMGGGKANISYYVTPVRAGRVILELGGRVEFEQVLPFMQTAANKLPFAAMVLDSPALNELREEYRKKQAQNMNPITYKRVIQRNIANSMASHMSNEYDQIWYGKYE